MHIRSLFVCKALVAFAFVWCNLAANAQVTEVPNLKLSSNVQPTPIQTCAGCSLNGPELANSEKGQTKAAAKKTLLSYLKTATAADDPDHNNTRPGFYYHLANTFARLRLYPLAMKCYLKAMPRTKPSGRDTDTVDTSLLNITSKDDSLIAKQGSLTEPVTVQSKDISYQTISATFNDGKKAVAYAMLFHVKQPVRGKRRIFVLNNVGHTFITLIKYNSDSSYTSLSFGFYPKKDNLLSATPIIPSTSSVFKDDSGHEWDEVVGKFISKHKFERIQNLIKKYDGVKYNLSRNNCTDFGIKAAQLAGIAITETYGSWPLGEGNNPAVTGQSILAGKFYDADAGNAGKLFFSQAPGGQ